MKHIADEVDKLGKPIKIFYSDKLAFTPSYKLVLSTHLELVEKGLSPQMFDQLNDFTNVVWAEDSHANVLGGIAFTLRTELNLGYIVLSFTDPKFRRRGINLICRIHVEQIVKEHGFFGITSFVHLDNKELLLSAEKNNFKPYGYYMFKKL